MSLSITLNHLKDDFISFLCYKFNVNNIYKINEILTNNQGQFHIGSIPITGEIEKINYPIKKSVEKNELCITLHELKDSFITFLIVKYKVISIYDLEVIFSKYQPENDGIFIIGKIPLTNNGDKEIKEAPKLVKVLNNIDVKPLIEDNSTKIDNNNINKPIEDNYCIIEDEIDKEKQINLQVKKAYDKKNIEDHFILQKYGKGILLSCFSDKNSLYQKNWANIYPDFNDEIYGGWWKSKGSLKKKSLEGWFFKIDYLSELLNLGLNIICDNLEEIENDKKEIQKKNEEKQTVSSIFEYEILSSYLYNRQTIENNIVFNVEPNYFDNNFTNFKMILIKHKDLIYSGIPHLKNKCLFFFGNIPF